MWFITGCQVAFLLEGGLHQTSIEDQVARATVLESHLVPRGGYSKRRAIAGAIPVRSRSLRRAVCTIGSRQRPTCQRIVGRTCAPLSNQSAGGRGPLAKGDRIDLPCSAVQGNLSPGGSLVPVVPQLGVWLRASKCGSITISRIAPPQRALCASASGKRSVPAEPRGLTTPCLCHACWPARRRTLWPRAVAASRAPSLR